jgi:hypothetical protein
MRVDGGEGMKNDLGSLMEWLRDCAQRITQENPRDLSPVRSQLRIISALARELLALKAAQL